MLWWHWFLIGAGTVLFLEAILFGILFIIGKGLSSLQNVID